MDEEVLCFKGVQEDLQKRWHFNRGFNKRLSRKQEGIWGRCVPSRENSKGPAKGTYLRYANLNMKSVWWGNEREGERWEVVAKNVEEGVGFRATDGTWTHGESSFTWCSLYSIDFFPKYSLNRDRSLPYFRLLLNILALKGSILEHMNLGTFPWGLLMQPHTHVHTHRHTHNHRHTVNSGLLALCYYHAFLTPSHNNVEINGTRQAVNIGLPFPWRMYK